MGMYLNDIANALGLDAEYTIDYTKQLGEIASFETVAFDDLDDYYSNDGVEHRGYLLTAQTTEVVDAEFAPIDSAMVLEGAFVYRANPVRQFSEFTNKSHQLNQESGLFASVDFMKSNALEEGDKVSVTTANGSLEVKVFEDNTIGANSVYLSTFDSKLKTESLFNGYRFIASTIQKV